jgi:hypothetical protein
VDVHGEVDHVRLGQRLDLGRQDLALGVHALHLQELQQREDQVPVQVLANLRRWRPRVCLPSARLAAWQGRKHSANSGGTRLAGQVIRGGVDGAGGSAGRRRLWV